MRRWSLRTRLALISVAGLGVGLAIGGVLLVFTLQFVLVRSVDSGAMQTATAIADLVEADRLPDPIPVAGSSVSIVQVVDAAGRVHAASAGADRLVPLLSGESLRRARAGEKQSVDGDRASLAGDLRVVGEPATDEFTVLVAAPVSDVDNSVRVVTITLLIGFPLLLAVLGILVWQVVGWTLRPVEELRRGAEAITGRRGPKGELALPVPASEDEVHRLALTLNDMLTRLDIARARQRAFVADAAHELRSPLASMRTQLEVSQRLGEKNDWLETASDLLIDVGRLSRLVDDLLLLARADDGAAGIIRSTQPVELTELVSTVVQRYSDARIVPTVHFDRPVWTNGDPGRVIRIVTNLVDNAVRHAESAVSVTVSGPAIIDVVDDGPGIPESERERVFARFTRLDDGRARDDGGTGLGLAIVRELVRLHGGQVTLDDARPGLRVRVTLPSGHTVAHD